MGEEGREYFGFYKMKVIKTNFKKNSEKSPHTPFAQRGLNVIADYFKKGKVVIYPTDTIYGLGCIATNKKAIERIYRIKRRGKRKPFLILVSDLAMLKKYCYVSKEQEKFLRRAWKPHLNLSLLRRGVFRPVTVILKSKGILPKELAGREKTLAVRLPRDEFLVKIIKAVDKSIISTSANISGAKYRGDLERISKLFGKKIDLIIDAGALNNKPSRIVDIRDIDNIKVVRK